LDRLETVIRNKFCESCLHEGHLQIGKRETSESGCQTEFARRIPREGLCLLISKPLFWVNIA